MAETKPTSLPRWATDANRTLEPTAGEKGTGWVLGERAPARHMNWLQNLAHLWFKWIDERVFIDQVHSSVVVSTPITTLGQQFFDESYTIPANTMRVGTTIRVRGYVNITSAAGGGNVNFNVQLGALLLAFTDVFAVDVDEDTHLWVDATLREIGGAVILFAASLSMREKTPTLKPGRNIPTIDTTIDQEIKVGVNFTANGNSAQLEQLIVDISYS